MITKRTFCVLLLLLTTFAWQKLQSQTFVSKNIAVGSVTIAGNDTQNYEFYGSTTANRIIIESGYQGIVKFRDLTMILTDVTYSPVTIRGKRNQPNLKPVTKVTLILEGDNRIEYRSDVANMGWACIQVDQGAQIHIRAVDESDNASGKLAALIQNKSGNDGSKSGGAAIGAVSNYDHEPGSSGRLGEGNQGTSLLYNSITGIGSTTYGVTAGGNIIISSGTVTAYGGHGAGIGGAFKNYYDGIIVVYGGIVDSKAHFDAAGIGSGCPDGKGVEIECTRNSSIIVLPPSTITAYGAGGSATGGVGTDPFAELGLAGTMTIIYFNDPNKPEVTIRTEDYEPDADIYGDLTVEPKAVEVFNALTINYDLAAVRFGRTDASGIFKTHAQVDNPITFFTDATSSKTADFGRPYLPVSQTIPETPMEQEIVLPLFTADISIKIYPALSHPLFEGYSVAQAYESAFRIRVIYNDNDPMTGIISELQNKTSQAGTPFLDPVFLAADSSKIISAPATLSKGDTIYIVLPIKTGYPEGIYTDIFRFNGTWKGNSTGWIRIRPEQRVVYDDADNDYIKVTAIPDRGRVMDQSTYTVTLNTNITHIGRPEAYDPQDVYAKYVITTEADYNAAVSATPVDQWNNLNVPSSDGSWISTIVPFDDIEKGIFYIHWFVISGTIHAHSKTVIDSPALYGGFGPYINMYLTNDPVTTFEYGSVNISILNNDALSSAVIGGISSALGLVTEQPKAGTLTGNGSDIIYTHTKASVLEHEIDSFTYKINAGGLNEEAKVYIYVIRSDNKNFAACKGSNHTINLLPTTDISYSWYNAYNAPVGTGIFYSIPDIQKDVYLGVAPMRTAEPYKDMEFPIAPLMVKVVNPDDSPATMRWTGTINTDWHNPANWVSVNGEVESPVFWIPTSCVNVIIPIGAPNYPELNAPAVCNNIHMEDRAMIVENHFLEYDSASVELKLTPSERDRFVMWTPPLMDMYSGDYHLLRDAQDKPVWGDVFMSYFMKKNPDYNGGKINDNWLSATFGHVGSKLDNGFNLKVVSTTANKGKSFVFPRKDTEYTGEDGITRSLDRTKSHRFFTDDRSYWNGRKSVQKNIVFRNDINSAKFRVFPNPFMAYFDAIKFIEAFGNGIFDIYDPLEHAYRIWNGDVNEDMFDVLVNNTEGQRYVIKNTDSFGDPTSSGLVPPLQSFIVAIKPDAVHFNYETFPFLTEWATTKVPGSYVLKSENAEQETNLLRIKATQENKKSTTLLHYNENAKPSYDSKEDASKVFHDEIKLMIYTLTPLREPLSINSSADFISWDVPLGVYAKEIGPVILDFSGMETFGHKVYLIDKELKGPAQVTDLQVSPTYKFAVTKPDTELNDRFLLRMDYTGVGLGNESVETSDFNVYAEEGYIYVQSGSAMISDVQVYTITGATVYSNSSRSYRFSIQADRGQIYIVKAVINGERKVRKVFVK